MNRETQPMLRTPNPGEVAQMPDVLAQLQSSGSIHFWKVLRKTAIHRPTVKQNAKVSVPKKFVQDHAAKVGELVTLRVRTSSGRSSRSWLAHCCVAATLEVSIVGGWPAFAVDNRLQLGDFVVFVLREDAKSEFEVQVFRGPGKFPYFPDQGERPDEVKEEEDGSSGSEKEEQTNNPSRVASPVHQQDEHNQAFRRDSGEENPAPFQQAGNPRVPPRFSKRFKASDIGGSSGQFNAGQSEFPDRFIRAHGEHVHDSQTPRFVHVNDLKEGQQLQFSLMADSYFLVRRISEASVVQDHTL